MLNLLSLGLGLLDKWTEVLEDLSRQILRNLLVLSSIISQFFEKRLEAQRRAKTVHQPIVQFKKKPRPLLNQ